MINRAKDAKQEKRGGQHCKAARDGNQQTSRAIAEKERRQERPPAEAIGQPADRQCKQPERYERAGGKPNEIAVALLEVVGDGDHGGWENQQHEMVERMGPIHEQDGPVRCAKMCRHRYQITASAPGPQA